MNDRTNPASEPEEEKLPWLQRVEEDAPSSGRRTGLLLAGGALVFALLAVLVLFVLRPPHFGRGSDGRTAATSETDNGLVSGISAEPDAAVRQPEASRPTHAKAREAGRRAQGPDKERPARAAPESAARVAPAAHPARHSAPPVPSRSAALRAQMPLHSARRVEKPMSLAGRAGTIVQLGAFDSQRSAERAWDRLGRSYPHAAHSIERAVVRGRTYYRLRVLTSPGGRACHSGRNRCFIVRR